MTDLKSRVSSTHSPHVEPFRWSKVLKWITLAALLIGSWLASLMSLTLAEATRGSIVLFHPSDWYIVISTFLMLSGVVLLSIQLVSVINYLMHGNAPPDH